MLLSNTYRLFTIGQHFSSFPDKSAICLQFLILFDILPFHALLFVPNIAEKKHDLLNIIRSHNEATKSLKSPIDIT